MPHQEIFKIGNNQEFKHKALLWGNQFANVCFLDNNNYNQRYHSFDVIIAIGKQNEICINEPKGAFDQLKQFYNENPGWLFGYLSYDLKNDTEKLTSENIDHLQLPSLHFFQPENLIVISKSSTKINSYKESPQNILEEINRMDEESILPAENGSKLKINQRVSKEEYLETAQAIRKHIIEGGVYELNYCQEFFAKNATINPAAVFENLNKISPMPFSCYYKLNGKYLMCASPERFLKKVGDKIISQPIKGTIARGKTRIEDEQLKAALFNDEKERAENVMIVDLVRNDLAKSAVSGTVNVEELYGIYSFEQLHQMISTVSCRQKQDTHVIDIIKNAFPMGSMTGAPKVRAMKLIEHYEKSKRGLFSGTVGYFDPNGDFDFNVVIRSILFNAKTNYLSYQVGSAIVYDSNPEKEYEECLLKAKAIETVLQ